MVSQTTRVILCKNQVRK